MNYQLFHPLYWRPSYWISLVLTLSITTSACLDTTDQVSALAPAATGISYDFATHPLAGTGQGLSSSTVVISSVTAQGVSPVTSQGGTGTSILITGTGFASGATVTVGALNCPVTALTSFLILCTAPANATGATYNVTVTNTDASTATATSAFTQNDTPTLTSISPSAAGSGTTITLTGTNFNNTPSTTIKVGGTTCTSPTYVSATSFTCVIPAFLPTATTDVKTVDVVLTNPDGQTATLTNGFTYVYAATQIASGTNHTCALVNGGVKCWGKNDLGQLGNSTTTYTSSLVPLNVPGLESGVSAIAAGGNHSCALISGKVKCWGSEVYGELGNDYAPTCTDPVSATTATVLATCTGNTYSAVPVTVQNVDGDADLSNVQSITAGKDHTCAIVSGNAWCWGRGDAGQIGDNTGSMKNTLPVQVVVPSDAAFTGKTYLESVSEISAGEAHTCALAWGPSPNISSSLAARIGVCWGLGTSGQLGDDSTTALANKNRPVMVQDASATHLTYTFNHITAGGSHSCGMNQTGTVFCWGDNSVGQLGKNSLLPAAPAITSKLPQNTLTGALVNLTGAQAISAGTNHTCAIINGVTYCWGKNNAGQIGNGTLVTQTTAASITSNGTIAIASGGDHSCAITATGIQCWGTNTSGEGGTATNSGSNNTIPVSVSGSTTLNLSLSGASVGQSHACVVIGGKVRCWGANASGQVGNSTLTDLDEPSPTGITFSTSATPGVLSVQNGVDFSCALLTSGTVQCWGSNYYGQLGDGTTATGTGARTTSPSTSVSIAGTPITAQALAVGGYHACAIIAGIPKCWGHGTSGQLGNSASSDSNTPVVVTGITGAQSLALGLYHSCALVSGIPKCWGDNSKGQLGDTTTTTRTSPVAVSSITTVADLLTAGGYHTCATVNGAPFCWGMNTYGQLGNGSTTDSTTPVNACSSLPDGALCTSTNYIAGTTQITAGLYHTCAIAQGTPLCWGLNSNGQLGTTDTINTTTGTRLQNALNTNPITAVQNIFAGGYFTCFFINGSMQCTGQNSSGQLGNNSTTSSTLPVYVLGF